MMKRILRNSERGQAIILIAFAIIGLIAIIGLMTDAGVLFIEYARLKRAIDAASISAALQFRQGLTKEELQDHLTDSAVQFLKLNQSDVIVDPNDPDRIQIDICDTDAPDPNDPVLCPDPFRKLVRVTAAREVHFGFLRVLGFYTTRIHASSIGEAASVDMVLVIDTSSSMSYETDGNPALSAGDDPSVCNITSSCQPMHQVKTVINNPGTDDDDLLDTLYFPYDRVALVTMTSQTPGGTRDPQLVLHLNSDETAVRDAIDSIHVYEPVNCSANPPTGPCLQYSGSVFQTVFCPARFTAPEFDPSSCTSSNIGGAMLQAGSVFAGDDDLGIEMRQDSLWIVIVLAGGPPNASDRVTNVDDHSGHNIFGHCPRSTWPQDPLNPTLGNPNATTNPTCVDFNPATRHCIDYDDPTMRARCEEAGGVFDDIDTDVVSNPYDADDYALDWADWVADPIDGQGATIFTIGLGDRVVNFPSGQPDRGQVLLQYMARTAGNNNATGAGVNHGEYYFAPQASDLALIFQKIADNIFTRISQ